MHLGASLGASRLHPCPGCALTVGILTIVSAVLAAVGDVLHAEAAVDLPPIVVPETLQIVRAIVVRLASLFPGEQEMNCHIESLQFDSKFEFIGSFWPDFEYLSFLGMAVSSAHG